MIREAFLDTAFAFPRAIDRARLLQKRLDAAIRSTTFPKALLVRRARELRAIRARGGYLQLRDWFADYGEQIKAELITAVAWRYRKPVFMMELAA